MSDETNAGLAPASEPIAPVVETPAAPAPAVEQQAEKPASSPREALERAFAEVAKPVADHPSDPNRYADGTFKPTKPAEAKPAEVKPTDAKATEQPTDAKPLDAKPPVGQAPERFVKAAKDAWATTPDVVRAETERAITELTAGIEKYRPDAEAFATVKQFDQLAKESGTTLAQALTNYVNYEQLIAQNPLAAFVQICRNRNMNPAAIGAAMAGLQPQQIAQLQQMQAPQPQQPAQQQNPNDPVLSRLEQMENMLMRSQIDQFAASHPHFDDLRPTIGELLKTGFATDLPDAYAKALRLTPEVSAKIEADNAAKAAPIPTQQPDPAQTRQKAALSLTGSPNSGSNPAARKPAGSAREALQSSFAQVGLS